MVDEHPDDKHIVQRKDGWYFWDEVGVDQYGPYESKQAARDTLKKYVAEVLETVCEWIYYDGWNAPCHANEPTMEKPDVCPHCKKPVVGDEPDFGGIDE